MCVPIDLDTLTTSDALAERGYNDPVIRGLAASIDQTEDTLAEMRGFEYEDVLRGESTGYDGSVENHLGEETQTYATALQATCLLHGAVLSRLETLAREMGEDPEEVLYDDV